ncbi:MAG: carboxy terminal-processing peptidase [Bacteroidales bacterium]|nr:carboxy terminal-processing peptidase [Bacteroidales bacterium]
MNLTITYKKEIKQSGLPYKKQLIILLYLLILLYSHPIKAQEVSYADQAYMLTQTATEYHYKPRPVDSAFSVLVFHEFIERLDPERIYFTKSDMQKLKQKKHNIAAEIKNREQSFLSLSTKLYTHRINFTDSLLKTFKDKALNYNAVDTLVLYRQNGYLSEERIIQRWKRIIKYYALSDWYDQNDSIADEVTPGYEMLSGFQNNAIDRWQCRLKSKYNHNGGLKAYIASNYLKSVASAYDPHSSYFSHTEEQAFSNSLSKNSLSFGFQLIKNDFGELEIDKLIPGSPAWKSNALNEGDIIVNIASAGKFRDFTCISYSEAIRLLSSDDVSSSQFTVRKANGEEIKIALRKAETEVQDNIIRSFLLKGEKNIGYIYLPSFYTEAENNNLYSKGSANDMARELIKLKRENISGLILDLRNNGGGAILEAVLMAGMFINRGTISIVQSRHEGMETLKDANRGTIYNDPLIILVNKFTASASELFTAALQDYNRAIIVGTKTNGKSSMQTILPLDASQQDNHDHAKTKSPASFKLTIGAFYRVDGHSFQISGIPPDITLPSIYDSLNVGEMAYPTALQLDSISKKAYFYPSSPLPVNNLQNLSSERIRTDSTFNRIKYKGNFLFEKETNYSVPLYPPQFQRFIQQYQALEVPKIKASFTVENPSYLKGISSIHDANKEIHEDNMADIQKDAYIQEAYYIMCDYINQK